MGLSIDGNTPNKKLENAIKTYKEIVDRYVKFQKKDTNNCKNVIDLFDTFFPDYKDKEVMTDTKK